MLLWPPEGRQPAPGQVEAKRRDLAFDLRGKKHITISGIGIVAAGIASDDRSDGIILEHLEGRYLNHSPWIPRWWWGPGDGIRLDGAESIVRGCDLRYSAVPCSRCAEPGAR